MKSRFDKSVFQTAPLRFATLWAMWFVSFFFFDGETQNGTRSHWLIWAGAYLCISSSILILIELFPQKYHVADPRKYVETACWAFMSASCFALAVFSQLYPVWVPFCIGAALCATRTVRGIND